MSSKIPDEIKKQIKRGIEVLEGGGVIAFPTDTVYGLGAAYDDIAAIERIYRLKQRQDDKGMPLLVTDRRQMARVAVSIPPLADKLLQSFAIGSLTLVLKKADSVPYIVTGGNNTVAVRITAHPVAQALIKGLGRPVVATSANISGRGSALTAQEVCRQLGNGVDLIVDDIAGNTGIASTIVDVSEDIPDVLREGEIKRREIEKACRAA